jgi:pyruvate dehydrogenase E2 component (dihydrolipoamide acetyltransferase)
MAIEITMPRLSDTMQQGTVVKWNVKEGQSIKSGDTIADIETDKATMELQSFDDGIVARLAVNEGQTVPVGTVIVVLAGKGEDVASIKAGASTATPAAKAAASGSASTKVGTSDSATAVLDRPSSTLHAGNGLTAEPKGRIFASPLARKIAEESGVDLAHVEGTGPGGRIVRKDVEAVATSGSTQPATRQQTSSPGSSLVAARVEPTRAPQRSAVVLASSGGLTGGIVQLSNMRRTIARRLVESKTTIPHYQVTIEVDMEALVALRAQLNEQLAPQGVKLSVNDFIVRACALAMHQHPFVNARWVENANDVAIELLADVNIGVAIALDESKGGGLVVATIRNADAKGLRQISSETKAYSEKARTKGLSIEDMSDSTFTISNLGMFGVDHFTAIINPPNAAILAVGAAAQKPVVRDGQLVVGHAMSMTMSSDHRVIDGAMAAQYLASVKAMLEKPATLLV